MKNSIGFLRRFFLNYLWLGVAVMLLAIVIDKQFGESNRELWFSVLVNFIGAVGVSVLVASIFTFASGTSSFIDSIRDLLEDIIIKRNFLSNIDPEGKKEALKALIQPSSSEVNKYPNIGDYYGYFIDKTLEIRERNVRSNYSINARAFFCTKKKLIAIEATYNYRLFPSENGFNEITLGFEDKESSCASVVLSDPKGERAVHSAPKLEEHNEGGDVSYRATINANSFGEGKNHIDVELKLIEYGVDHWKLLQFKALQPTDGFRFQLYCDDDITIKEHAIFVVGAKYRLDICQDKKSMTFTCNQWVNEGTGLCVLVSFPEDSTLDSSASH